MSAKNTFQVKAVSAEQLKKMSKAEQRVLIAKDVIARIEAGRIKVKAGNYFVVGGEFSPETPMENVVQKERCTVCALGAVFACSVVRFDRLEVRDLHFSIYDTVNPSVHDRSTLVNYLTRLFSKTQLDWIETAFEGSSFAPFFYGHDNDGSVAFFYTRKNPTARLQAIMENIVENNGTFKPKTDPAVRAKGKS